ncbi:MAG: hypothetical protein GOV00_00530 [Candidatus Altiarchaeota archaeon]|nr:hypothetical protein [Candidatus Altiarchaeota archaeon]
MNLGEEKLKQFIRENNIDATHFHFEKSVKTVADAIEVSGASLDEIIKTIIFKSSGGPVAAIVSGKFRASKRRIEEAVGEAVTIASPEETLEMVGYPAGGVPCIGHSAKLVVDPLIFEQKYVFTGGGSLQALVKISTDEIRKLNPIIKRIRGKKSN